MEGHECVNFLYVLTKYDILLCCYQWIMQWIIVFHLWVSETHIAAISLRQKLAKENLDLDWQLNLIGHTTR